MTAVTELYVDNFHIEGKFANFKNMPLSDASMERIMTAIRNSPIDTSVYQYTFIVLPLRIFELMRDNGYKDEALTFGYTLCYNQYM